MATRYLGIVMGFVFVFTSCRYKDNDKFVLSTVKHRIEKTWYMKKCVYNDVVLEDYISDLTNNTLTFFDMKKNKVVIKNSNDIGFPFLFKDNKSVLVRDGMPNEYTLKITKLTKDELWIEGYDITNTLGSYTNKIKAKFSSKK